MTLALAILALLLMHRDAGAQVDPAYSTTLAHRGEWVTCPDTDLRVARVARDISIGDPLRIADFTDWQRPFHAPHENDRVENCPDGQAPFDPYGKGLHVERDWRR